MGGSGPVSEASRAGERVRTWLFAPADDARKCRRAAESGADQVIWDLEDGVDAAHKEGARANLAGLMADAARQGWRPWVRIATPGTADAALDLGVLRALGALGRLVVPKADQASVHALSATGARAEWLLIVESARGLWDLARGAVSVPAGVRARLAFGALDYALDVGLEPSAGEMELLHARSEIVWLSRALGLPAPVDAVEVSVRDLEAVEASARRGYRLGFGGKLAIHPAQLEPIRRAFRPDAERALWARRVLAAQAEGRGAAQVDGAMVDRPVFERARAILAALDADGEPAAAQGDESSGGRPGC